MMIKGKKLQMTQVFLDSGRVIPVTVVRAETDLNIDLENKQVEVEGISKGKGFTGAMKKWNFHGEQATRGQSDKPRSAGSVGGQTPGRVFPGKKMAGRHGSYKITLKKVKIVKIDLERKEIMLSGPVPGARNSLVKIRVYEG